jgi:hypothetical protein
MREDEDYKLKIISKMQGFLVFVVAKWLREQELKGLYSVGRATAGEENTQAALKPSRSRLR